MRRTISLLFLAALGLGAACSHTRDEFDLVVLGGSPGGVAAAVAGARQGLSVCLVAEREQVGGALAAGLGTVEGGRPELLGGLARETFYAVERHYRETYGPGSQQVRDCAAGLRFEPQVAEAVLERLLARSRVSVLRGLRFVDTDLVNNQIQSVRMQPVAGGAERRLSGKIFVDATYGGDVYAETGAPFRLGREGREVFGESLAGRIFQSQESSALLPASTGAGDSLLQAAGYSFCLTDSAANQAPWPEPQSYDPERYRPLSAYLAAGARAPEDFIRLVRLPNRKWAAISRPDCPVSLDAPGALQGWPTAEPAERETLERALLDHALGLFKFLRTDPEVPAAVREAFASLAPAADEFTGSGNLPFQPLIREARRLDGRFTYTQADALDDTPKADVVALSAAYPLECAPVSGQRAVGAWPEGCFSQTGAGGQLGYTLMLPAWLRNLIVPVALSASHVGWCGLNREPLLMLTGQAAGVAAALCIRYNCEVDEIPVNELQALLRHDCGAILSPDEARPWAPEQDESR